MTLHTLAPCGSVRVGGGVALGDGVAAPPDAGVAEGVPVGVGVGAAAEPGLVVELDVGPAACEGDDAAATV